MSPKKEQDLTKAITELEKIVEELGNENLNIEDGLQKFKKGAELIKFCKSKLQKAENEFTKIKEELESDDTF